MNKKPHSEVKENCFEKFLTKEIPIYIPMNSDSPGSDTYNSSEKEEPSSPSSNTSDESATSSSCDTYSNSEYQTADEYGIKEHSDAQTSVDPKLNGKIVNLNPLKGHVLIEDCTSSDDESETYHFPQTKACSNQPLSLTFPQVSIKHQRSHKVCFVCGQGHVVRKCPERHSSISKGKTVGLLGSKGNKGTPSHDRLRHTLSKPAQVKRISHNSRNKRDDAPTSHSFLSNFKQNLASKFNSFKTKVIDTKQIWRVKREKGDAIRKKIPYVDKNKELKTTMAWVSPSNLFAHEYSVCSRRLLESPAAVSKES